MEELIWAGIAVAVVLALKWWRGRKGNALPAPPAPDPLPPPVESEEPPATIPFDPPKKDPDPPGTIDPDQPAPRKGPLQDLFDRLRKRRETPQAVAAASDNKTERGYQADIVALLNREGITATDEYVLKDGCRVDIVTDEFVIEIDFAHKWAECVGQVLHYAHMTSKKPVCLILVTGEVSKPGVDRCRDICHRERIEFWTYDVNTRVLTCS
jgi:hypothetical protein